MYVYIYIYIYIYTYTHSTYGGLDDQFGWEQFSNYFPVDRKAQKATYCNFPLTDEPRQVGWLCSFEGLLGKSGN